MSAWLDSLPEFLRVHRAVCLVTVLDVHGSGPREAGAKMVVAPDGTFAGTIGGGNLEREALAHAREVLADDEAGEGAAPADVRYRLCPQVHQCCGGTVRALFEVLRQAFPVHVFGAGHVARELADVLRGLDFGVTIVDEREEWNTAERFPSAKRVVADPMSYARTVCEGYALVMTHDHDVDFRLLEVLLAAPLDYVGLIGSQTKKRRAMLKLPEALAAKLVSPIGLAIGGKTPREIAISVAAELVALRNGMIGAKHDAVPRMCDVESLVAPARPD